jgi:hypothetical protein
VAASFPERGIVSEFAASGDSTRQVQPPLEKKKKKAAVMRARQKEEEILALAKCACTLRNLW